MVKMAFVVVHFTVYISLVIFYISLWSTKTKTNSDLILLTSIVSVVGLQIMIILIIN